MLLVVAFAQDGGRAVVQDGRGLDGRQAAGGDGGTALDLRLGSPRVGLWDTGETRDRHEGDTRETRGRHKGDTRETRG